MNIPQPPPPSSPSSLTDTQRNLLVIKNSSIIDTYKNYVIDYGKHNSNTWKKKYISCTDDNVLEYFCNIIKDTTGMKNLNPTKIADLVEGMNRVADNGD